MRWASWARNTCHTVLTWLPGDQSPSPSRPERKSVEDKEVRGDLGVAGKKPHIKICGQSLPLARDPPFCARCQAGGGASAHTRTLTRSVTSTQRFLVPRCPRCGFTPVQRQRRDRRVTKALRSNRHGIRGQPRAEWALTIGCPQLGLQWTQGGARWEVGSQVEFPMAGTVLGEGQAVSQVLQPGGGRAMPSRLNPGTQDPL